MAHVPNYYEILSVSPDADEATIKQAFKAAAKQVSGPNDPAARQLKEAYDILTDAAKRQQYDSMLNTNGGDAPTPASTSNGNGHGKWEYLTLKSSRNYGTTKYYINDEQHRDLKDARFSHVINLIGEDGWEMVGIAVSGNEQTFIFKRAASV